MRTEQASIAVAPLPEDVGAATGPRPRAAFHAIEPRRGGLREAVREIWLYRRFIGYFGRTLVGKRYARTWLGSLWLPLRPGISIAMRILVFGGLVGISGGAIPYPLFFLTASASWQLFAECAYWSTRSIEVNRATLRKVDVPRLTFIIASLVPAFLEFLVYLGFATLGLIYYYARSGSAYLVLGYRTLYLVPAGVLLTMMLGLGIGLATASASARAKDVRYAVRYALAFVYFVTPVIYPLSQVPNKYRPLAELNPVTGSIGMFKDGLFGTHSVSSDAFIATIVAVVLLWVPGVWLFHRREVASAGVAP
jgi:lipopolysaccharide transport system permease protein